MNLDDVSDTDLIKAWEDTQLGAGSAPAGIEPPSESGDQMVLHQAIEDKLVKLGWKLRGGWWERR